MSRRKQANPKSLREEAIKKLKENEIENKNKNSPTAITVKEEPKAKIEAENSTTEKSAISNHETSKNVLKDDCFFKNMTNKQLDYIENRKSHQYLQQLNNKPNQDQEPIVPNLNNQIQPTKPSRSRSSSSSSSSSYSTISLKSIKKSGEVESKPEPAILLTKKPQEITTNTAKPCNKRQKRKFNSTSSTNPSQHEQQNQSSILINGKRYYPLIFTCENCGLRYSDQSTLNTHKQNYCTKRNQQPHSSSSSSSSASSSTSSSAQSSTQSSPVSSRSNSPLKESPKIELLKSVIYQCNNCLFQTDKKSAMNRHSRVHLPQKRKQMEESASNDKTLSNKTIQTEQLQSNTKNESVQSTSSSDCLNLNDKSKSYCKDCDIQFSSIKTYQHHRNNYCQKYKTIESVVPVQVPITSAIVQEQKLTNDINKEIAKKRSHEGTPVLNNIKHVDQVVLPVHQSNKPLIPPNAVRMGDLVYLPMYKINHLNENLDENNNITSKPLDLTNSSFKNEKDESDSKKIISQVSHKNEYQPDINLPLDLSIKSDKLSKLSLPVLTSNKAIKQPIPASNILINNPSILAFNSKNNQSLLSPQPTYPAFGLNTDFDHFLIQNSKKLRTSNNMQFPSSFMGLPHLQSSQMPYTSSSAFSPNFHQYSTLTQPNPQSTNPIENKIYHCQNCQQFFLKFKQFKRHKCLIDSTQAFKQVQPKLTASELSVDLNDKTPIYLTNKSPALSSTESTSRCSSTSSATTIQPNTKQAKLLISSIDKDLLKHPLVKKTLVEFYGNDIELLDFVDEDESKISLDANRFGNNVKNFYMCTTCGYRGNTARGVKQHGKLHLNSKEHFGIVYVTETQPYLVYASINDSDLKLNRFERKILAVNSENSVKIEARNDVESNISVPVQVSKSKNEEEGQQAPFSKKARLLDFNNQSNQDKDVKDESDQLALNLNKSQAFCFKCNIQFQHINNYLAHKKTYCKDI